MSERAQLTNAQREEITKWAEAEASRAKVRSAIHGFTDLCFNKCVNNASADTLNSTESECIKNCVGRFLDTNTAIVEQIANAGR